MHEHLGLPDTPAGWTVAEICSELNGRRGFDFWDFDDEVAHGIGAALLAIVYRYGAAMATGDPRKLGYLSDSQKRLNRGE